MPKIREFVPDGVKAYLRLVAAKLRFGDSFIGSPWIAESVVLGRGCSISRGVELGPGVRMGDFSYANCSALIHSGEIGRFCSIGPYAQIGLALHPVDRRSTSPLLYGSHNVLGVQSSWQDFPKPPVIGSDVWIGAAAFISQGVRVGHGAVIGAGAVVTHDVAPYAIVAGVPARVIRMRFGPATVDRLLDSRWWEMDLAELRSAAFRFDVSLDEALEARECLFS